MFIGLLQFRSGPLLFNNNNVITSSSNQQPTALMFNYLWLLVCVTRVVLPSGHQLRPIGCTNPRAPEPRVCSGRQFGPNSLWLLAPLCLSYSDNHVWMVSCPSSVDRVSIGKQNLNEFPERSFYSSWVSDWHGSEGSGSSRLCTACCRSVSFTSSDSPSASSS